MIVNRIFIDTNVFDEIYSWLSFHETIAVAVCMFELPILIDEV